ncbi:MAG: DUF58 domain-containing protein [Chitinophagaceae bacterium]|nr:MAG: DUF58 domain-containing protein [Chitinophagaceae bacterium]
MFRSIYLNNIVYYLAGIAPVAFVLSYFFTGFYQLAWLWLLLVGIALLTDSVILFTRKGINASRDVTDRLSIGDENRVLITVENLYGYKVHTSVIDELPVQFQERHWVKRTDIPASSSAAIEYMLRPESRGEYTFHDINVFAHGPLRLVKRRYAIPAQRTVKVYPSYFTMRRYQLLAVSNRLQQAGVKKIRRLGHSMEFEQIKEYVRGDDYRTINWKATARKDQLMVNNFTDERSQQVYCVINQGRVMKMPFNGLTLLDHSINAALVLANVALVKQDRAGLITFSQNIDAFVGADKKTSQMNLILETLYRQKTNFLESDYEKLFSTIRNKVTNRGLVILFTNFESMESLSREMPALKRIARYHLLMVVFFENTELKSLREAKASTIEDIYIKTIAEKFAFEKKLMVRELHKQGILSVLTTPENLTVNTINKYLELKTRLSI